ncbi:polysaccharide lyase 6 family protein [Sphingomonas donggukensis]|uniref:Polysaccharide lyase 6 family protein n=1 Tax=Sphingomonas donggukensis TaxID=2949093 RepID=A0ABY4TTI0_9SPHN|nr:polysaccharide lyase 6 family protein [Sphingomonas donggukensis]URW74712.1 polysaccharide lyase 6 family protein [Sphingomonas donggukensis]
MKLSLFTIAAAALAVAPAHAETLRAADAAQLAAASARAKPGDTIVLADGVWRDAQLVVEARGTAAAPITVTAQTRGKVILSGASNLRIGGEHLVVAGLVFRDGYSPTKEVIALRRDSKTVASNVRLTEIVIDRFNQPDRRAEDIWVALYGADNRVDHSWFAGKGNAGVTLAVIRPKGDARENRHRIDHNYFGPRPPLGSNGGETIRIGTSHESLSNSRTVVEQNLFERCDGEVEIISVKSGANIIRENLIVESQGSIVLRHGNGNIVERNVIRGNGKPHTGGIRIINRDQIVRGNYIERVAGTDFTSAIAVMNGVPNSPINRYHQVANAVIENNSIIDSARITLGAGADAERSAPPVASRFAGNLIRSTLDPFRFDGDASGISFAGNMSSFNPPAQVAGGVTRSTKDFAATKGGLLYLPGSTAGAPQDLVPLKRADAGPSWYPKVVASAPFKGGRDVAVAPGALEQAVRAAGAGDTLRLAPGTYRVATPIAITRPLTIFGPADARISFAAPTLFQLGEGGSLKLDGVSISGSAAPRTPGNAIVRAAPRSTIANYTVMLDNVTVADLASPGFDVIATTPATFADRIDVRLSRFSNITGAIVAAAAERGKDGLYPAELVRITKSRIADVGRIVDVARLGTDESTFGPAVEITDNDVTGGGTPAVRLSGVQSATITGNGFARAGVIDVAHSVGFPVTNIRCNRLTGTPAPRLAKLYAQGSPVVTLDTPATEATCATRS